MVAEYTPDTNDTQATEYIKKLETLEYITLLKEGKVNPEQERPIFSNAEIFAVIRRIEDTAIQTGKPWPVKSQIEKARKKSSTFDAICRGAKVEDLDQEDEDDTNTQTGVIVPSLPDGALLPRELGNGVSQWFDNFTAFSKKWSPRACDIQHKGLALWMLSSIAMRRVAVEYGGLQYTPLYIVLVAPSTVWAKTKTAKIGTDILKEAGLNWLFGSNQTSPEKLLSSMAGGHIPANWGKMTIDQQERKRRRLAHSGQLTWYYSEFGQLLQEWADNKGRNAAIKHILLRMDDGESDFSYATIGRDEEIIENPYMALLATLTPDGMRRYAGADSPLWGDGTLARIAFCCPPANKKKTLEDLKAERLPSEKMVYPSALITPLHRWNERLKERECNIVPDENIPNACRIELLGEHPLTVLTLGKGVKDALDDYGDALAILAQDLGLKQLESCYGRFRDKALRIATLIAAFEGSNTVELPHMAFAQHITEEFRESIHNLGGFLQQNSFAQERERLEDDIVKYVKNQKTWITARMMTKNKFKGQDPGRFETMLDGLVKAGELITGRSGKMQGYSVPNEDKRDWPPTKKEKAEKGK